MCHSGTAVDDLQIYEKLRLRHCEELGTSHVNYQDPPFEMFVYSLLEVKRCPKTAWKVLVVYISLVKLPDEGDVDTETW